MNSVYCLCSCHVCLTVQINTCCTSSLCSSFCNRNIQTKFTFSSSKIFQGFTSLPPSNSPVKGSLHVPRRVTWFLWCKYTVSVLQPHNKHPFSGATNSVCQQSLEFLQGFTSLPPSHSPVKGSLHVPRRVTWCCGATTLCSAANPHKLPSKRCLNHSTTTTYLPHRAKELKENYKHSANRGTTISITLCVWY